MKNALCNSVALFISHCFGHCPPPPSIVESACNDSGCEVCFIHIASIGCGGGIGNFAGFLQKCPKTFGQDCRLRETKETAQCVLRPPTSKDLLMESLVKSLSC